MREPTSAGEYQPDYSLLFFLFDRISDQAFSIPVTTENGRSRCWTTYILAKSHFPLWLIHFGVSENMLFSSHGIQRTPLAPFSLIVRVISPVSLTLLARSLNNRRVVLEIRHS